MVWLSPFTVRDISVRLPIKRKVARRWIDELVLDAFSNDSKRLLSRLTGSPALLLWYAADYRRQSLDPDDLANWIKGPASAELFNVPADQAPNRSQSQVKKQLVALKRCGRAFRNRANRPATIDCLVDCLTASAPIAVQNAQDWLAERPWVYECIEDYNDPPNKSSSELAADLQRAIQACRRLERFDEQLQVEKLASLKQLAYGASHEINNPLANIASRAQMLMRDESDPQRRRRLQAIDEQAFRAHEMISDLMLFAHPPESRLEAMDLLPVVQTVISELEPIAGEQQTELKYRADQLPAVLADRTQIAVAVKAVVTNAMEALRERGTISVEMEHSQNGFSGACISISDTGPGLGDLEQRHLFDPFFSGREAGRGLGFGLSKAWRIMEMHGGKISAENGLHSGAVVRLRIPYAKAS